MVRDANITFTIKKGNLILWGLEKWGDIKEKVGKIRKEEAIEIGFRYIGGRETEDKLIMKPKLEYIPVDVIGWNGEIGKGYDYKLIWVMVFKREGYNNTWEIIIDAETGKVMALRDLNLYIKGKVIGARYPITADECCPEGCAELNVPFPYVNIYPGTLYTNYGGMWECTMGQTYCTSLDGLYVILGTDPCSSGDECSSNCVIDLDGVNGQHDCTISLPHSFSFAARTCINEITHLNRNVRSWLDLAWLDTAITCNVNINSTCNAYYTGNTINFYRSGGGCRNTGEIAAVFDHEWGHALDYNDSAGGSIPNDAIADYIAAMRLHESCIGRGFFWTLNRGCGEWTNCPSNPGTSYGYNCNGYSSPSECCLNCTGIREINYMKHLDSDPETISNFTCPICSTSSSYYGPCGREAHCESIPPAEAAWDLGARDLQSAPFNYDKQTAFLLASKIILQGHNNVTNWYSCTCPNTASGCGATNAHMNWLAADDDDGNLSNGTPHASAIYAALNRHEIACITATQTNSGCSGGPSGSASLTATPGNNSVSLQWSAVAGASTYYVWRTEGVKGCDLGKTKIATASSTNYTDTQALNERTYYYAVQAVGTNTNCLGPLSNCISFTPTQCLSCAAYLSGSATVQSITGGDNDNYIDNCESATIKITIQNIGTGIAQNTNVSITPVDSFLTITTPMPINVGNIPVGGTVDTTFNVQIGIGSNKASCQQIGTYNISVQATGQEPAAQDSFSFTHEIDAIIGNLNWPFETSLDGWTVEAGTWTLSTTQVNPGGSTYSVHSSDNLDQHCDIMISPGLTATSTTELHIPNWYDIEVQSGGYWYDRANVWIVQGTNETVINPISGKLYASGNFYNWSNYCNQSSDKPGWSGTGTTWGDSIFNLGSYNGQSFQLRIKYMTDDLTHGQGVYLDDMYILNIAYQDCDQQSDQCSNSNIPGKVLNNLNIAKSGTDLILTWQTPGGTCTVSGYALYRGTLPWSGYNHDDLYCNITTNSITIPQDLGSYYYLIVPLNSFYEGLYGLDSSGNERPKAQYTPCASQNINHCN